MATQRKKSVLVIGGSSGIGAAVVQSFQKKGWEVCATYCHKRPKNPVRGVAYKQLDVTATNKVDIFVRSLRSINAVVFAVGLNTTEEFNDFSLERSLEIFSVNVGGPLYFLSKIHPKLAQGAAVVFFSSPVAVKGTIKRLSYASSKAALVGAVQSLAREFAGAVRVNCVFPGYINTDQYHRNSLVSKGDREKCIVTNRLGEPSEVAALVYFLCSPESSYVNGANVAIDGGLL